MYPILVLVIRCEHDILIDQFITFITRRKLLRIVTTTITTTILTAPYHDITAKRRSLSLNLTSIAALCWLVAKCNLSSSDGAIVDVMHCQVKTDSKHVKTTIVLFKSSV